MHWSAICIPGSPRAGDSGHTAGLKCREFKKKKHLMSAGDVPGF